MTHALIRYKGSLALPLARLGHHDNCLSPFVALPHELHSQHALIDRIVALRQSHAHVHVTLLLWRKRAELDALARQVSARDKQRRVRQRGAQRVSQVDVQRQGARGVRSRVDLGRGSPQRSALGLEKVRGRRGEMRRAFCQVRDLTGRELSV